MLNPAYFGSHFMPPAAPATLSPEQMIASNLVPGGLSVDGGSSRIEGAVPPVGLRVSVVKVSPSVPVTRASQQAPVPQKFAFKTPPPIRVHIVRKISEEEGSDQNGEGEPITTPQLITPAAPSVSEGPKPVDDGAGEASCTSQPAAVFPEASEEPEEEVVQATDRLDHSVVPAETTSIQDASVECTFSVQDHFRDLAGHRARILPRVKDEFPSPSAASPVVTPVKVETLQADSPGPASSVGIDFPAEEIASDQRSEQHRAEEKEPDGSGTLFKCSLCDMHVYESQLNYHMSICVDPPCMDDAGATLSSTLGPTSLLDLTDVGGGGSPIIQHSSSALRAASSRKASPRGGRRAASSNSPERSCKKISWGKQSVSISTTHSQSTNILKTLPNCVELRLEPLQRSESMPPRLASQKRLWRQWKDSELEKHHTESAGRQAVRQAALREEVRQAEIKECTFEPQLFSKNGLSRSGGIADWAKQQENRKKCTSERVQAEMDADVTLRPKISRFAQTWSAARLETQREASVEQGFKGSQPSVFDRLYMLSNLHKSQANEETLSTPRSHRGSRQGLSIDGVLSDAGSAVGVVGQDGGARPSRTRLASASPRRIPTSQLLYCDAKDRLDRHKSLQEQASEQVISESRSGQQVSSKSRRYYWQMLERQVKTAFDAATNADSILASAQLEDFLLHFGCLRLPKVSTALALERFAEESRRLRAALWRHLDPQKVGHVDLLAFTVFFHVLMGAIDEDTQGRTKSHELEGISVGSASMASSSINLAAGSPGQNSTAVRATAEAVASQRAGAISSSPGDTDTAGGIVVGLTRLSSASGSAPEAASLDIANSSGTLPPITEEGAPARSSSGRLLESLHKKDCATEFCFEEGGVLLDVGRFCGGALGGGDEDNARICSLLSRFDPVRLRTEFHQIYRDRMHHNPSVNTPAPEAARSTTSMLFGNVSVPELDPCSRYMAERVLQREREASGGNIASHADLLDWRKLQKEEKCKAMRAKVLEEEVRHCTFHPNTQQASEKRDDGSFAGDPRTRAGSSEPRHEMLYAKAKQTKQCQEARAINDQNCRSSAELVGCTFKPNVTQSERSFIRGRQNSENSFAPGACGHQQTLRGFDECKLRLRRAFAGHTRRRNLLEERFTTIDATASAVAEHIREERHFGRIPTTTGGNPPSRAANVASVQNCSAASSRSVNVLDYKSSARGVGKPERRRRSPSPQGSPSAPVQARAPPGNSSSQKPCSQQLGLRERVEPIERGAVVLCVEVNIAPNQPAQKFVLRQGQTVAEAAADFATRHMLAPALAQRLHRMLQELHTKQEKTKLAAAPSPAGL